MVKEINELNADEEKEIKKELQKIYQKVRTYDENVFDFKIKKYNFSTRSGKSNDGPCFTDLGLKPKNIHSDREYINLSIIINGFFNEIDFMNSLMKKIIKKFPNNCQIALMEGSLKFLVNFEYSENNKEKLGKCTMEIELFKFENEKKYLLEFIRTEGEIKDYYENFLKINDIISKNINNN